MLKKSGVLGLLVWASSRRFTDALLPTGALTECGGRGLEQQLVQTGNTS